MTTGGDAAAAVSADTKLVVACDMDEVLCEFLPGLIAYWNLKKGTSYKMEDFTSYNFADVWGGTNEETVEFIHQWFEEPSFDEIPPIVG